MLWRVQPLDFDIPEQHKLRGGARIGEHQRRADRNSPAALPGPSAVPRRAFLMAGFAAAVGCAFPHGALAMTTIGAAGATKDRHFSVLYGDRRIGSHSIVYSSDGEDTRVSTEIHLVAKVAFFTVFAFNHRSEEIWRDGRLMSLRSETAEHGEILHVEGAVTPDGFRVVSKAGQLIAPAATLTSNSLWTPAVLEQATVVDAQHGGIVDVRARRIADEDILIDNRAIRATRYTFITPNLAGSIWYDQERLWVHGEFERDGSKIHYQLEM
jgi:Family of unknown function (DUF6134)